MPWKSSALILVATLVSAAEPTAAQKARARTILEQTADSVPAASPAVQVLLLRDLGELYRKVDRKKAIKLLTEAFSSSAMLKPEWRDGHQGKILGLLAEVDLDAAIERLAVYQPVDPEAKPVLYESLVRTLLQRDKIPAAVELFEIYSGGNYPFKALDLLLERLAADDPRRVVLFGRATTAYGGTGGGAFPELLAKRTGTLPRESVEGAEQAETATPLLDQIKDLDLRLLAQAALARGLLGEQLHSLNMNFSAKDGKLPPNVF